MHLKEHVKKQVDPDIIKHREEHYNHLADIARVLWSPNINIAPAGESDEYDYLGRVHTNGNIVI